MNISINYHAVSVKGCLRNAPLVTEEGHKEGLAEVKREKKNSEGTQQSLSAMSSSSVFCPLRQLPSFNRWRR